jgi:predicted 2-oxoglutarate/Fe(II)-dependent dioxygenase YbiX
MHFDPRKIKHLVNIVDTSSLLESAKTAISTPATVGNIVDNQYVSVHNPDICTARLIDYSDFADSVDQLVRRCEELVEHHYSVECVTNSIDFLHYPDGTHYWPHIDGQYVEGTYVRRSNVNRDITCVVYLNDDYEGGEVYFPFFDITKRPNAGDILMYPGSWQYLHGVNKVVGVRYAIVIWFHTTPEMYQDEEIKHYSILKTFIS